MEAMLAQRPKWTKMDLRNSWWWAFEMVEIHRMARVRHNGAESGHQIPLEDGAGAPPDRGHVGTFFDVR